MLRLAEQRSTYHSVLALRLLKFHYELSKHVSFGRFVMFEVFAAPRTGGV